MLFFALPKLEHYFEPDVYTDVDDLFQYFSIHMLLKFPNPTRMLFGLGVCINALFVVFVVNSALEGKLLYKLRKRIARVWFVVVIGICVVGIIVLSKSSYMFFTNLSIADMFKASIKKFQKITVIVGNLLGSANDKEIPEFLHKYMKYIDQVKDLIKESIEILDDTDLEQNLMRLVHYDLRAKLVEVNHTIGDIQSQIISYENSFDFYKDIVESIYVIIEEALNNVMDIILFFENNSILIYTNLVMFRYGVLLICLIIVVKKIRFYLAFQLRFKAYLIYILVWTLIFVYLNSFLLVNLKNVCHMKQDIERNQFQQLRHNMDQGQLKILNGCILQNKSILGALDLPVSDSFEVTEKIEEFYDVVNSTMDFINKLEETSSTNPLLVNPVTRQVIIDVQKVLTGILSGLPARDEILSLTREVNSCTFIRFIYTQLFENICTAFPSYLAATYIVDMIYAFFIVSIVVYA